MMQMATEENDSTMLIDNNEVDNDTRKGAQKRRNETTDDEATKAKKLHSNEAICNKADVLAQKMSTSGVEPTSAELLEAILQMSDKQKNHEKHCIIVFIF
ncbi:hypothetical protein DdX_01567 [Ditylenchus destructor]|uniref:Uncharacterized protein n=1 Tax=Ditylenchus destructor TaxID=166010 RepID=A0AAD4R871_9BILA|nr:hypothetical protein DdX_01567 [Ditylenchus destructor]